MDDEHFYKNKSNSIDGYSTRCKRCEIKQSWNWIQNNYEQFNETRKNGYFQTEKFREWMKRNFVQKRQRMKEWRQENKDKVNSYNKKREQNKTHEISKEDLEILYEYAESKCMYCDMTEEYSLYYYGEKLHKDHAYNNGSNGIDNCILACKGCNCSKHTKDWDEWFTPENPIYDEVNYNKIKAWLDSFKTVDENII